MLRPHGIDAIVFDLDGTLWDSTETVAAAWTTVVRTLGQPERTISPAEIAGVMGMTHREIYRTLFPGLPEAEQESLALACYREEERSLHALGGRLYPGVADGLARLARRYPLCIVSNCQQGYIETFLAWSGLGSLIRDFECHGNTGCSKAENLRRVVQRNALAAPIYVGDTESDRRAAVEAGVPFVHAAYGFGSAGAAERTLRCFGDLEAWLADAPRAAETRA